MDFEQKFKNLEISDQKKQETLKNPRLLSNLKRIFHHTSNNSKLIYILSTLIDEKIEISDLIKAIENKKLKNEKMIRGAIEYIKNGKSVDDFLNFLNFDDLNDFIENYKFLEKKELMKKIYKHERFKYLDGNILNKIFNEIKIDEKIEKKNNTEEKLYEEGLLSFMHKPGENPQLNKRILEEHLKQTGGKVVTRFPPEPNGFLHIGHAKALNLDFGYAEKFGGITYLRFDDTNPRNEKLEYYENIIKDVEWLGFKPYAITAASDYFDKLIEFAFILIDKGLAYCCHQTKEEIQEFRKSYKKSPWRDRKPETNRELFQEMIDGKWNEGSISLRLKMDYKSKNPLMHDLVAYRVIKMKHMRANKHYNVYPSYDYTHCINDSLENITHSFCSREFYLRRDSYYWLVDNLEIYRPVQWEFSRLNISNTVLSKRKLTKLVNEGIVDGWDDPRLFTISGLRRRGFPPKAINKFARSVGITYNESIIDVKLLENYVRDELNQTARRVMVVRNPIKLIIENLDSDHEIEIEDFPKKPEIKRKIKYNKIIYIDSSDFKETTDKDYLRFTPTQPVGLYKLFTIKFKSKIGNTIKVEITDEKPKKYIQWVSDGIKIRLKNYSALFKSFNPEEVDMMKDINYNSLEIVDGIGDKRILGCKKYDVLQFQRIGFYCVDEVLDDLIVFNLCLSLRNQN